MLGEGDPLPDVRLYELRDQQPQAIDSASLCGDGRTRVLFALPGAFTPTCSSQHLPQYEDAIDELRRLGVDEVICLAVNDPYVMAAWAEQQQVRAVRMLADGNGAFADAMGLRIDQAAQGLGLRSRRYSMLVRDGRIAKLFVEPDQPGDPYGISSADTMLRYLSPDRRPPPHVALLSKPGCPYCAQARALLDEAGLHYTDVPLPDATRSRVLAAIAGSATVPQVFVDGRLVGGNEALTAWLRYRGAAAAESAR